jgi:predicted transcriptional regulator
MGAKQDAIRIIRDMPEDCSTEDILAELYFKKQVDSGLEDIAEGRFITHDELKSRIVQWRSSIGR